MAPKSNTALEEIKKEKTVRILDSALILFAEYGYHQTSVSKIAQHAGIAKGLIYNYFESKEDILKQIFTHEMRQWDHTFDPENLKEPKKFLRMLINLSFDAITKNTDHYKLLTSLILQPKISEQLHDFYIETAESKLKIFIKLFKLLKYKQPREDALKLGAILDGITLGYYTIGPDYPLSKMKKKLLDEYCN